MKSDADRMMEEIGIKSIEELFSDIPKEIRLDGLDLPKGKGEMEVVTYLKRILRKNESAKEMPTFIGCGVYDHFIPSAVAAITSRSEFYTSYTPYQAELSQGILQALFEYQSLIAELTGMEAVNTSMYDASTALGEAALMASRINGRKEIIIPKAMHWEKKSVLRNYCIGPGLKVKEVDYDSKTGKIDLEDLRAKISEETSAVYLENPNFFGVFEDQAEQIKKIARNSVLVAGVNPLSLALAKAPGDYGADIVIGEGQIFGNAMNFGGPLLGIFACREEHIRKMPGRIVGLTKDVNNRRSFCLTLQSREQHIRKEKATSNICTNESLCAVASAVYMSVLGGNGIRKLAEENILKARDLMSLINQIEGFEAPVFEGAHFNEFVVRSKRDYNEVHSFLLKQGIHGGLTLKSHFPELGNTALFATTEVHTKEDFSSLVKALEAVK